jgi:hypothetical protein
LSICEEGGARLPQSKCVCGGTQANKGSKMQQREEWWAILAEGNQVAKEESKRILGNKRSQVFHKVFIDSTKAKTLKVTVDELAQIACISVERKEKIRAAHKVEGLAWDSQKRLMFKLARKYAFRLGWVGEKLEDLIGEAEVAFCKCVRGYSDPNFSFGAYMGMAIMTELRRYVNRNRGGLGKANAKLLEQYNNKKEELEKAGLTSTFDDVVCAMGLGNDREKRRRLWNGSPWKGSRSSGQHSWSICRVSSIGVLTRRPRPGRPSRPCSCRCGPGRCGGARRW